MKIVLGLGNIGKEYEKTNHNVGFLVVDKVLAKLGISKHKEMCNGIVYEANIDGEKVYFVKPTTYMNNSGMCLSSVLSKLNASLSDCLIVVDDIDLPVGSVRIRKTGSAGTHNGLRSLVSLCGQDFARIRVGIDKPINGDLISHVLGKMPKSEEFENSIEKAVDAVIEYVHGASLDAIMQKYNG